MKIARKNTRRTMKKTDMNNIVIINRYYDQPFYTHYKCRSVQPKPPEERND